MVVNILYCVAGEGSGHSSRSKEILSHLKKKYLVVLFFIILLIIIFVQRNHNEISTINKCVKSGGEWTTLLTTCVDWCSFIRGETPVCGQAFTWGCDCGPDECWDGESCELNYIAEFSDCIKIENLELGPVSSSGLIIVFNENVTSVQVESFIKEHFYMDKIRKYDYKLSKPKLIAVEMEKKDQLYWICKLEIENYTILDSIDFNLELRLQ